MTSASNVLGELGSARQPLRIADIAERLGVHPNTVRFHLSRLIERGQVERVEAPPSGPGRPAQLFRAVRRMDPKGPRHFRWLAEVLLADLVEDPDGAARALAAGRAWGARISAQAADPAADPVDNPLNDPADRLVELMDDLGFAPEPADSGGHRICLRNCPFLELAEARPQLVCGVHLGLVQGVLDGWQAPLTADRLEPFAEPDRCLIHLASRAR